MHFPFLWVAFTKLSGGMNINQNYVAKRMLNIFAKQKPENSLSTTFIHLRRRKKFLVLLLP